MKSLIEALLFPPGVILIIAAAGLLLIRRRPRAGTRLIAGGLVLLYLSSLPAAATAFMRLLQTYPALAPADLARGEAQAILVLGGGRYIDAPEYGGDTLSPLALERLRYGVHLHRQTALPLIMTGGSPDRRIPAEAVLLKEAAVNDFQTPVLLTEEHSDTTWENAANSAALLRERGIQHIYLVTHAWHMPRAMRSFAGSGLIVTPAPTGFATIDLKRPQAWLPSARALYITRLTLHEFVGLGWYRLRGVHAD